MTSVKETRLRYTRGERFEDRPVSVEFLVAPVEAGYELVASSLDDTAE